MIAKINTFGLLGIDAYPVTIEVDVAHGLPAVNFVGLADTAIRESKERVKSAIKNSGFKWPLERITVSLAPSDIKKEGSSFDLPIALGILAASQQIAPELLLQQCARGELSLDGSLRPVPGTLCVALAARNSSVRRLLVPAANAQEAAVIPEVTVVPVTTLRECIDRLGATATPYSCSFDTEALLSGNAAYDIDFAEIKGQRLAKRAIEIAAAGAHNIVMIGPPGSGKTMLAKRIPTILPSLTLEECVEITKVYSACGLPAHNSALRCARPFRAPHHSATHLSLVGGGANPTPGEVSLAHHGVLFLDELPEFNRRCLEAMRQPLEDRSICITRINRTITFPAAFMLVCALNPCPCGYYGDSRRACTCSTTRIQHYMSKISGPLLDRIDIHIELPSIRYQELAAVKDAESSTEIKARVEKARAQQRDRLALEGISYNAQMSAKPIKKYCPLKPQAQELLKMAMHELGLSARAYDKILRVSRTIADLAGSQDILTEHLSEAIQYRILDRNR